MRTHLLDTLGEPVKLEDFYAIPTDTLLDGLKVFEFKASDEAPTISLHGYRLDDYQSFVASPRRSRVLPIHRHHQIQR